MQVNYFHFVAEEVRAGLASLGMRSLDELIGRADLLRQRPIKLAKTENLDLSFLTTYAGDTAPSSSRAAQEVCALCPFLTSSAQERHGEQPLSIHVSELSVLLEATHSAKISDHQAQL